MNKLDRRIKDEFNRLCKVHSPSQNSSDGCLSEYDVLTAYVILSDYFLKRGEEILFGIKSFNLLSSAVNRQNIQYVGIEKWTTPYQKIAVLLYGLDKNHAFEDCNKRTALLSMLWQLYRNRLTPKCSKEVLETLCVRIAANELTKYPDYKQYESADEPEIEFLAHFIRNRTRKINKRFYIITYREFNRKLNEFGFRLDNPKGNYIDVIRSETIVKKFGFIPVRKGETKIMQVGFPGWKKQINEKAAKSILSACGLTERGGFDSDVFFHNETPLFELIKEYREPLIRLKDR